MHSQSMQFVAGEWKESAVDSTVMKMCGVGCWGLFLWEMFVKNDPFPSS